jgi:hypothetical protein
MSLLENRFSPARRTRKARPQGLGWGGGGQVIEENRPKKPSPTALEAPQDIRRGAAVKKKPDWKGFGQLATLSKFMGWGFSRKGCGFWGEERLVTAPGRGGGGYEWNGLQEAVIQKQNIALNSERR